jgi:hypothetical protein
MPSPLAALDEELFDLQTGLNESDGADECEQLASRVAELIAAINATPPGSLDECVDDMASMRQVIAYLAEFVAVTEAASGARRQLRSSATAALT